jgi:hypothetical protein
MVTVIESNGCSVLRNQVSKVRPFSLNDRMQWVVNSMELLSVVKSVTRVL